MKSDAPTTGGDASRSAPDATARALVALILSLFAAVAGAQTMYKYRGGDGEWIYSDRPPDDGSTSQVVALHKRVRHSAVRVTEAIVGGTMTLTAHNTFYAPVELALDIERIDGIQYPDPDEELRWVLPPRSDTDVLDLPLSNDGAAPALVYQFKYVAGDPAARHQPPGPYRAPFSISSEFPVTQAYPEVATHTTPDSYYAVDIAMPIGTDIVAARDGIVFDVASRHFSSGLDPIRDGPNANVVRILHDDGTYAIYAHLNTNTIRVKPGDRVRRGQYIADSGNTGYSSGPHLHFAVVRNAGMHLESVPFTFQGPSAGSRITPSAGMLLTAY
ncbi:MAG: M23 family metallopeptidase [Woeseiaceae bacterium]